MSIWSRFFGNSSRALEQPPKSEVVPSRSSNEPDLARTVVAPSSIPQQQTTSAKSRVSKIDVAAEYRRSSQIFALTGGAAVVCPSTGTDKEKIRALMSKHRENLLRVPPIETLLSGDGAEKLLRATKEDAEHLQHLIAILDQLEG